MGVKIPPNLSRSVVLCRSYGLGSLPKPTFVSGRGSSGTRCPHRRHGAAPRHPPPSLCSQAAAASWRCAQLLAKPALGKSFCFQRRGAPLPPEVFTSLGSFCSDGRDGVQEGGELTGQRPWMGNGECELPGCVRENRVRPAPSRPHSHTGMGSVRAPELHEQLPGWVKERAAPGGAQIYQRGESIAVPKLLHRSL